MPRGYKRICVWAQYLQYRIVYWEWAWKPDPFLPQAFYPRNKAIWWLLDFIQEVQEWYYAQNTKEERQ
jgi:hypothetical protein